MRETGLTEEMKKLAAGKAILAPTNGAFAKALSRLSFVTKASSFQPKHWNLTADRKLKLHNLIAEIFVPAQIFRRVVKVRLILSPEILAEIILSLLHANKASYHPIYTV